MVAYVLSVVLVVGGGLVLLVGLVRVRRAVRRFTEAAEAANLGILDALGLLRARNAALGVAIRERRHVRM